MASFREFNHETDSGLRVEIVSYGENASSINIKFVTMSPHPMTFVSYWLSAEDAVNIGANLLTASTNGLAAVTANIEIPEVA